MHSQLILASAKLEIAERERDAKHRFTSSYPQSSPRRWAARRLAGLSRRSAAVIPGSAEVGLRVDQNPSV